MGSPSPVITLQDQDVNSILLTVAPTNDFSSFPSRPIGQADVSEAKVSATFVYNFFLPNETSAYAGNAIINIGTTSLSDLRYYYFNNSSGNDLLPMYNKIDLTIPVTIDPSTATYGLDVKVSDHLSSIIFEENFTTQNATGLFFQETKASKFVYTHLSASAVFSGIDLDASSLAEAGRILNSFVNPVTVAEKRQSVVDMIANLSAEGCEYIDSNGNVIQNDVLANVASVKIGSSISNLMIGDVVNVATEDPFSIYFDEMKASVSVASTIQRDSRASTRANIITTQSFDGIIKPIRMQVIDSSSLNTPRRSVPIGYIIEKVEITPNGVINRLDPIVSDNITSTSYVDSQVRYGHIYIYTPRIVFLVEMECTATDSTGAIQDQAVLAEVLIAGRGIDVEVKCEDLAPPLPPYDVKFNIDDLTGHLLVSWDFPPNPTRDIKYFQVFRRASTNEAFEMLAMHDFNDATSPQPLRESIPYYKVIKQSIPINVAIDEGWNTSSKYIYSIVAVDAHGLSSSYSTQFEVSYDRFKQRLVIKSISRSGAPKIYPNFFLSYDTFIDSAKDSNSTRMRIFFDPEYFDVLDGSNRSLGLLKFDESNPVHRIQILNTDLQQTSILNIGLTNKHLPASSVSNDLAAAIQSFIRGSSA